MIETNPSIFGPVFLMLTLTLIVWVYMYANLLFVPLSFRYQFSRQPISL
ncbi:MAG: hypothetical protein ACI9UU_001535 [Candidatus Azotimanducaceae bacterium]|jgi:hypothetical protein